MQPVNDRKINLGRMDQKSKFKEDGESPIQATVRLKVSRSDAKRIMENKIKIIASGSLAG